MNKNVIAIEGYSKRLRQQTAEQRAISRHISTMVDENAFKAQQRRAEEAGTQMALSRKEQAQADIEWCAKQGSKRLNLMWLYVACAAACDLLYAAGHIGLAAAVLGSILAVFSVLVNGAYAYLAVMAASYIADAEKERNP